MSWNFGDVGGEYHYFFGIGFFAFFLEGKTLVGDGLNRLHPNLFGLRFLLLSGLLAAHILWKWLFIQLLQYLRKSLIQVLFRVEVDL